MRIDANDRIIQKLAAETRKSFSLQESQTSLFHTNQEFNLLEHSQSTLTATLLRAPDTSLAQNLIETHFTEV